MLPFIRRYLGAGWCRSCFGSLLRNHVDCCESINTVRHPVWWMCPACNVKGKLASYLKIPNTYLKKQKQIHSPALTDFLADGKVSDQEEKFYLSSLQSEPQGLCKSFAASLPSSPQISRSLFFCLNHVWPKESQAVRTVLVLTAIPQQHHCIWVLVVWWADGQTQTNGTVQFAKCTVTYGKILCCKSYL